MSTIHLRASYLHHAFGCNDDIVAQATKHLNDVDYDTLVGTGLSGALVVPTIARALNKHWVIVRKNNDGSHSDKKVEGSLGERWVFVDDLVQSGATKRRVQDAINEVAGYSCHQTTYVGDYLYYNFDHPVFDPAENASA